MKSTNGLLTITMLLLGLTLSAAPFSSYDFTFFNSVYNSDNFLDTYDYFLWDYTGYGFVGSDTRLGVALRIELGMPYSSLHSLFSEDTFASESAGTTLLPELSPESALSNTTSLIKTDTENLYHLGFMLGLAYRYSFVPRISGYLAIGARSQVDITRELLFQSENIQSEVTALISFDFDFGIKFNIGERNRSFRIGVYATYPVFSFSLSSNENKHTSERTTDFSLIHVIDFLDPLSSMDVVGYISMGYTYTSWRPDRPEYTYEINYSGSFTHEEDEMKVDRDTTYRLLKRF